MAGFISRQIAIPSLGKPASDYAVGDIVKLPVNNVDTEFIVVHQGNPDSAIYDTSCDGTWLLMKECYSTNNYGNAGDFAMSGLLAYLNTTFMNALGNNAGAIKFVKIPTYMFFSTSGTSEQLNNALPTCVFLPSPMEVGFQKSVATWIPNKSGAKLGYFILGEASDANTKRIAYYNSTAQYWWLRDASITAGGDFCRVNNNGRSSSGSYLVTHGIRPMFLIDYDTKFDPDTNIIIGKDAPPSNVPITVTGSGHSTYCYVTINGTKYSSATSGITAHVGDTIDFRVYSYDGSDSEKAQVLVDGANIFYRTQNGFTVKYFVPNGINSMTINLSYNSSDGNGVIIVTTS